MIFVGDEEEISPRSFGVGRDLGDALQDGSLEIEFEHHPQPAGKRRVEGHRKVEAQHVAGFEYVFERRKRLWLARFPGVGIDGARWAEGAVDRGVLVE